METQKSDRSVLTANENVGNAVGMSKEENRKWFVAVVKNNTEKSVAEKLSKMGFNVFVPVQEEYRVWKNGKRVKINRVVIPSLVFIKCSHGERMEIVRHSFVSRFMTNRAGSTNKYNNRPLAVVPEYQIEKLKFMIGNSETPVYFSNAPYKRGEIVRVIRGNLIGLEGEIQAVDDKKSELIIRLDSLGNARLVIDKINIEKVV